MTAEARELLMRLKRIHDEMLSTEHGLRTQRARIREGLTLLRLGERPAVVVAILDSVANVLDEMKL